MINKIKKMWDKRRSFLSVEKARQNRKIQKNAYNPEKRGFNMFLGGVMVGVGLVTLPLPTGSIFLIMFGMFLFYCPFSIYCLTASAYREFKIWWSFLW